MLLYIFTGCLQTKRALCVPALHYAFRPPRSHGSTPGFVVAPTAAASSSTYHGRKWVADRALARRTGAPVFPPAGAISTAQGHEADAAAQLHTRTPDRNHGTGCALMAQAGFLYSAQELLGPALILCRPRHLLRGWLAPQADRSSLRSYRLPTGRLALHRFPTSKDLQRLPFQCVQAPRIGICALAARNDDKSTAFNRQLQAGLPRLLSFTKEM
ncbi:hypothetical protein NDU88_005624 [Pleurodeles waltl]|uniref:Uncharacterized protein n=1 Tax=Pleurodeles waltl TaxID=8319 RepID=A0AAV7RLK2_PLEWA|nr:hypothetical protein NDU88_005624 [Pleurodeles waltl]